MTLLTDEQKREFMRTGFLVVPNAIDDEAVLSEWQDLIWENLERGGRENDTSVTTSGVSREDDPISYLNADARAESFGRDPTEWAPLKEAHEATMPYIEELVGEGNAKAIRKSNSGDLEQGNWEHIPPAEGGWEHVIRFPEGGDKDATAREHGGIHMDGWSANGYHFDPMGRSLNRAVYVDRVAPRGGGFTVYPGTHWKAADYWRSHKEYALHDYCARTGGEYPFELGDPLEISGDGGTLILWHGRLVHHAGPHHCTDPRLFAVGRLRTPAMHENHMEALQHPFRFWEGMEGIELDVFSQPRASSFK